MMELNSGAESPGGAAAKPLELERARPSAVPVNPNQRPHGILSLLVLVRDTVLVTFDALRGRYDG
jgi:hypothetical protein